MKQSATMFAAAVAAMLAGSSPAAAQCDSFTFSRATYTAGTSPTSAAFGDVNGDQRIDLAVSDPSTETVSILLGTSQGGFGPAVSMPAGRDPRAVALGDLDGDGDLDIAVCNRGIAGPSSWQDHGFTVLWNAGGVFPTSSFFDLPATAIQPGDLVLGDLDGDGRLDVVECVHGSGGPLGSKVASFLGNGAGRFAAPLLASTGFDPIALTLGDYDGDGALDAVTTNYLGNSFSNLHGNGDGTFDVGFSHSTTYPRDAALGDFDGDGDLDAVVAYRYGVLVIRDDAGVFNWLATLSMALPPAAVSLVDLDGDGDLDLAVANQFADSLDLWLGNGTGAFTFKEQVLSGDGPFAIAAGDIDADGDVDLALPSISAGAVDVFRNDCPLSTYCVAKLNSLGCAPSIGSTGTPSMSGGDDFHVLAVSELNKKAGLALFGMHSAALPFGGGIMCAQPPLVRSPGLASGGSPGQPDCTGVFDFHVSQAWLGSHGWSGGSELFVQFWSRDPAHPDGTGVGLSNGLRFVMQP